MANRSFIIDSRQIKSWEKSLKQNVGRMSEYTSRASNLMHQDIIKHFDQDKKGSTGSPWAKTKKAHKSGDTLIRTGTLRGSFFERYTETYAEVGTQVEYAAVHNFGYRKKNIPQREFLWISTMAENQITRVFAEIVPK